MSAWQRLLVALTVGGAALIASCGKSEGGSTVAAAPQPEPGATAVGDVPLGDVAGAARSTLAVQIPNPYANNPQAVQQGHDLFIKMNCAGCHGYDAKGAMGPDLTDGYWRYGGVPRVDLQLDLSGAPAGNAGVEPGAPSAGNLEARGLHPVARR